MNRNKQEPGPAGRAPRTPPAKANPPKQPARGAAEVRRLVQELEVHQAELEMQNEELRSARAALEVALLRSTELFEFAPTGYVTLTQGWKIHEINLAAARMFGRERALLVGKHLGALIRPASWARLEPVLRALLGPGTTVQDAGDVDLPSSEAGPHCAHVSATVLAREPPTLLLALQDVSERRRAELLRLELLQEAQVARAEAEAANRAKDHFLATLSHELRTPLSTLLMQGPLLRLNRQDPEKVTQSANMIERAAQAQAHLINDLLDVSRIISGKLTLELRRVELASVVREAVDTLRPTAFTKGVDLDLVVEDAPPAVHGDAQRLKQVVLNLLTNAVKFTPPGGRVATRVDTQDGRARVRVQDTGRGIEPSFLEQVFARFTQEDGASTRSHGGLGLGLSIARGLVEAHGGTVAAESPGRNQGATFTVSLPVAPANTGAELTERARAAAGGSRFEGVRILVVEDDEGTRESLAEMLRFRHAEVRTAGSAPQGFDLVRSFRPQVLLSDIAMPGEDGYSLMRRVRALDQVCPAVALTAHATAEDRSRALEAGFQAHVAKPVETAHLLHVLEDVLDAERTRRPGAS